MELSTAVVLCVVVALAVGVTGVYVGYQLGMTQAKMDEFHASFKRDKHRRRVR